MFNAKSLVEATYKQNKCINPFVFLGHYLQYFNFNLKNKHFSLIIF